MHECNCMSTHKRVSIILVMCEISVTVYKQLRTCLAIAIQLCCPTVSDKATA